MPIAHLRPLARMRGAFALAILALAAASATPATALGLRPGGVEIAAHGLGINGPLLQRAIPRHFSAELAGRPTRDFGPGARVVLRVTSAFFNAPVVSGGRDRFGFGESSQDDALEGEVLVLGPRNDVLFRERLLVHSDIRSAGTFYTPGFGERRVDNLAKAFAYWAAWKLR